MRNNRSISVSAPGKLLLMGDHAVVYGKPCIVTAVSARMRVTVTLTDEPMFSIDAPDVSVVAYSKTIDSIGTGDIPKGALFIETAMKTFTDSYPIQGGIRVVTSSDFPSSYGFGSSSASVVATLFAVSNVCDVHLDNESLFSLAYKSVLAVQGVGSGFDVAAAIWGGTVYFVGGGSVIEPLQIPSIPLIVGYSGVKADTATIVKEVAQKYTNNTEKMERIFDAITKLVDDAKEKMLEGDWQRVGTLMRFNQEYLRDIGVSTETLEQLIKAAGDSGAWGSKLSGAGGGDCMIALSDPQHYDNVVRGITAAGGTVLAVTNNEPGVRIETTDDGQELLIVVNEQDEIIDYRSREQCHADSTLLHRTVGIIITNDAGDILLQKRSMTKDMDPGLWGISTAGHVTKGQTDDVAIHREMMEELGVDTDVQFVGTMILKNAQESERAALYKGVHNGPFHIEKREVDDVVFMSAQTIRIRVEAGELHFTDGAYHALKLIGVLK